MRVQTTRFGTMEIDPERILHFPFGLPGFEQEKRYLLIEYKEGKFNWLQSVDNPDLAFIVCDPALFSITYNVPGFIREKLRITKEEDLAVLLIVRVEQTTKSIIPYVHSPLVFNLGTRHGIQWIMDKKDLERNVTMIVQKQSEKGGLESIL